MLDFFKIVSDVCAATECVGARMLNQHESIMKRRECFGVVGPETNRALIEYVQFTYPEYFGIKLSFPKHLSANRHQLHSENGRSLFFE